MYNSIRCALKETSTMLRLTLMRSKALVAFIGLIVILSASLRPVGDTARELNAKLNVFEPFIMLLNTGDSIPSQFFYIYMFFIVLCCDLGVTDKYFAYRYIRIPRSSWVVSSILNIVVLSAMYIAFVMALSLLWFIGSIEAGNNWSRLVVSMARTNIVQTNHLNMYIEGSIIKVYTPAQAFGYSAMYLFAYLFMSGMFISFIHSTFKRSYATPAVVLLILYLWDYIVIYYLPYSYEQFSLPALARLISLNNGYSIWAPSLQYAGIAWGALCTVLIIAQILGSCRFEVSMSGSHT